MDPEQATSGSEQYTNDTTRRFIREAQGILGEENVSEQLESLLSQLGDQAEQLTDDERAELTKLMDAGGVAASVLASLQCHGEFNTSVSDDNMIMALSVHPPLAHGRPVQVEQVVDWLKAKGIRQGVDLRAIQKAVDAAAKGEDVTDVVIVRGRAPKPGTEAQVQLYVRIARDQPLEKVEDYDAAVRGSDPLLCAAGDRILRLIPPTQGQFGYNALGEELQPPQPPSVQIEPGANVRAEGYEYFATSSGRVIIDAGRIEVRKLLYLTQDLTKDKGPIDFDGEVHMHAAVRSGAVLHATQNIIVDGPVEDAEIVSTEGDIHLGHGVAGRQRGVIRAAGDVTTRFAENVMIYAGRSIVVDVGTLHSHLVAGKSISLLRGRGQMIGGIAMAGDCIEARQIGARSGVLTEVTVGLAFEAMQQLAQIDGRILSLRHKEEEAREMADRIKRAIGDPTKLTPIELAAFKELRQIQLINSLQCRQMQQKRQTIMEGNTDSPCGHIDVHRELFAGVVACIGTHRLVIDDPQKRCRVAYCERSQRPVIQPLR